MNSEKLRNIRRPDYWSAGNECWKHRKLYVSTSVFSIIIAICFVLLSPKQYCAQIYIVDEKLETDLLLGLDKWSAWIKQNMPKQSKGLNEPLVYTNILKSEMFMKQISNIYLPTKHQTYYNYIATSYSEHTLQHLKQRVQFIVYSKYGTIILQVTDEDPYVAAHLVDSIKGLLYHQILKIRRKNYIIAANNDKKKYEDCHKKYEEAKNAYAAYADAYGASGHKDYQIKIEKLQQEWDLRFNEYKKAVIQYNRSIALAEREVPVFTVVKNTTVPHQASSPNLMGYLLSFFTISTILTTWFILGRRHFFNSEE